MGLAVRQQPETSLMAGALITAHRVRARAVRVCAGLSKSTCMMITRVLENEVVERFCSLRTLSRW